MCLILFFAWRDSESWNPFEGIESRKCMFAAGYSKQREKRVSSSLSL